MEHPLKVYFPHGGRYQLLFWYTEWTQDRLILAKSYDSVLLAVKRLVPKHPDIEIRHMFDVEIVAPPEDMCLRAAVEVKKKEIDDFIRHISYELCSIGNPLPPQFTPCRRKMNDSPDNDHWDCVKCYNGFCLVGMTPEEFYERYHAMWLDAFPQHEPRLNEGVYSQGRISDGKNLFVVFPGGMQSGVSFENVKSKRIGPIQSTVLFYYTDPKRVDCTSIKKLVKDQQLKWAEEQATREQIRIHHQDLVDLDRRAKIRKIFG